MANTGEDKWRVDQFLPQITAAIREGFTLLAGTGR
jgi:hypothetical protein